MLCRFFDQSCVNQTVGVTLATVMLFACAAIRAAQTVTSDDVAAELQRLTGVWREVSREREGQLAPVAQLGVLTQTARGEVTQRLGERIVYQGRISIDPARVPKAIDYQETASPNPAAAPGETLRGIYQVDGSTLTICLAPPGADRPSRLDGGVGTGCILFTYRRQE